ncbi:uncharacterized protein LOC136034602 [Artemia franciscana]|uniref:uncharacterized protein LOC136034602 n=1 Tax=Artemia franciscana TaxID=6661 RepID=UPI0032DB1FAE
MIQRNGDKTKLVVMEDMLKDNDMDWKKFELSQVSYLLIIILGLAYVLAKKGLRLTQIPGEQTVKVRVHEEETLKQATIGDGRTSLITGKVLDLNNTNGACLLGQDLYQSETSIPKPDPCHYCVCIEGKVDCFWKQCPPPPDGCASFDVKDVCNPSLYICSIPEILRSAPKSYEQVSQAVRRKRSIRQGIQIKEPFPIDLKLLFPPEDRRRRFRRTKNHPENSCKIAGIMYQVGETVGVASDLCLECRCAAQKLFCSPKCCFKPAPLFVNNRPTYRSLDEASSNKHPLQFLLREYLF